MTARQQWTTVGVVVALLGVAVAALGRVFEDELYRVAVGAADWMSNGTGALVAELLELPKPD